MLTDVVADAVTADVDVVSEITVVSGLFFCSSAVADVATALAAAKLPSILPVYTSDLMRGYLLLSPHIHSKTLSSGSMLWKNDRSFR